MRTVVIIAVCIIIVMMKHMVCMLSHVFENKLQFWLLPFPNTCVILRSAAAIACHGNTINSKIRIVFLIFGKALAVYLQ
jgi:hypothetical protein